MGSDTPPKVKQGWVFRGFLGGVAIGAVFGLLTNKVWEGHGTHREQIAAAFWGLLGGLLSLLVGVMHNFIQRR